jgi:hypothetical protein
MLFEQGILEGIEPINSNSFIHVHQGRITEINSIDAHCGGLRGSSDIERYETPPRSSRKPSKNRIEQILEDGIVAVGPPENVRYINVDDNQIIENQKKTPQNDGTLDKNTRSLSLLALSHRVSIVL